MNDQKNMIENLTSALMELPIVKSASYEYPGYWDITLTNGAVFYLGDVNGPYGWNDANADLAGDTEATEAKDIARDFAEWVKGLAA